VLTPLAAPGDGTDISGRKSSGGHEEPDPVSVGIGPIQFPGYLDRQEVMVRVEANRFEILAYDRWAEPLDENFSRVLMQNLSAFLRTDQVFVYPWPRDKRPSFRVDVQVLRFDANSAGAAELDARWTITDVYRNERVSSNELRLVQRAKDNSIDAVVTALSETVADFSREIARELMKQGDLGRQTRSDSAPQLIVRTTEISFQNLVRPCEAGAVGTRDSARVAEDPLSGVNSTAASSFSDVVPLSSRQLPKNDSVLDQVAIGFPRQVIEYRKQKFLV
jgi:uncharacterized lipoprotein YmbA